MDTIKHRAENLNNGGSVTVYYCGYEKCASGHFWGPAVRTQYLLHYVISGRGTYAVGGETYTPHAGTCFLIRPGERTVYTAVSYTHLREAFKGAIIIAAVLLQRKSSDN